MFGPSLDTGGGGISSSSSSQAGGDASFGSNTNNVSYGNSGMQFDKTTLMIGGAILLAVAFIWGRK